MDNTLWANTAVASGSALGVVVYTGQETRSLMNHSAPRSKVGLLDQEINQLTKVFYDCENDPIEATTVITFINFRFFFAP